MDESVFDWVGRELEARTTLSRAEARGTVRLALREAGLEPAEVTPEQMAVALRRVMPRMLTRRRVADADTLCADLAGALRDFVTGSNVRPAETAYDVFRRLGGDEG
jgi:hypothetical protein